MVSRFPFQNLFFSRTELISFYILSSSKVLFSAAKSVADTALSFIIPFPLVTSQGIIPLRISAAVETACPDPTFYRPLDPSVRASPGLPHIEMGSSSTTRAVQDLEFNNKGKPQYDPVHSQPRIPVPESHQYSITRFTTTEHTADDWQDLGFRRAKTVHESTARMTGIIERLQMTLDSN